MYIILYHVSRYRTEQMMLRGVKIQGHQASQWQTMRPKPDAIQLGDCCVPSTVPGTVPGTGGTKVNEK